MSDGIILKEERYALVGAALEVHRTIGNSHNLCNSRFNVFCVESKYEEEENHTESRNELVGQHPVLCLHCIYRIRSVAYFSVRLVHNSELFDVSDGEAG